MKIAPAIKHRYRVLRGLARTFTATSLLHLSLAKLAAVDATEVWLKDYICRIRFRDTVGSIGVRIYGSDVQVLNQIFADEDYACVRNLENIRTVVDFGSNIGLASIYFSLAFKPERLIAVEPDPLNVERCRANMKACKGVQIDVIEAGIWPQSVGLVVKRKAFRDGEDWSVIVQPAEQDEVPDVFGVDPESLFNQAMLDRVNLLKIDIEGSERYLFESPTASNWIRRVDNLVIELHDEHCELAFRRAMQGFRFEERKSGDVVACLGIKEIV